MNSRDNGELAIVLHSHMPYVEGFGTWPFGEEWLWEALAGVYLPLLEVLDELPVTLGLTPVLCDQMDALTGEAGERFLRFLREVRAPIHAEDASGLDAGGEHVLAAEVRRAAGDYARAIEAFSVDRGRLTAEFESRSQRASIELWAGPATHAVLPMLATDAGLRMQLTAGIASQNARFDGWSGGFWLPECAYREGLERELAEHGVRAFCVDQTESLGLGSHDQLEPILTEAGPVGVPIDWELISLVWDAAGGYPTHPAYRDYHGRTVHDLKPWNIGGGPYRHSEALAVAREHARDFVGRAIARLSEYRHARGRPGLACFALDTELLGHWWYEGLWWLRFVVDEARKQGLALATLPEALARHPGTRRVIAASTWGRGKDLRSWDSPSVAGLAFAARAAELETVATASSHRHSPALERAARELLALQSSDWAFQVSHELAADYPLRRARGHAEGVQAALAAVRDSRAESVDPATRSLAPRIDLSPLFGL
ncbi:MAG: glycoside hydrolase family 57 protein [Thermoleophilaceae bacterium]